MSAMFGKRILDGLVNSWPLADRWFPSLEERKRVQCHRLLGADPIRSLTLAIYICVLIH